MENLKQQARSLSLGHFTKSYTAPRTHSFRHTLLMSSFFYKQKRTPIVAYRVPLSTLDKGGGGGGGAGITGQTNVFGLLLYDDVTILNFWFFRVFFCVHLCISLE